MEPQCIPDMKQSQKLRDKKKKNAGQDTSGVVIVCRDLNCGAKNNLNTRSNVENETGKLLGLSNV